MPERHRPSTRPTGSQNSFGARPLWTVAKAKLARVQQLQLIAEIVGEKWEEMRTVFYRSMRAIEQALSARREYLTKEGQIMQGGPDHHYLCTPRCDEALS